MFGQTGNPSFGFNAAAQNSPFGQTAFGKTIATTSFGTSATPVFGSNTSLFNSKPNGSATGSLFGSTNTTPAFGANSSTQSTFGGFGNAGPSTQLFGAQQNANTNLFGTNNSSSAFGQTNKPTTFGFGQTTGSGLFGQSQAAQQSTPFGQGSAPSNNGLFGSTPGFGGTNPVGNISGTLVKFSPVTGTDTMVKNGVTQTISTRHHCITCMKEYESKSLEELRLEDYTAGRKGVAQGQPPTIFGTLTQGTPFSTAVSNSSNSGFGTITPSFGSNNQTNSTNLFSKPLTGFGVPTTTSSAFAFNSTTSSSLFNNQSKPFGGITTSTPLFSTSNTTSTVGSGFGNINPQNTAFGGSFNAGQSNQSIGLFSHNKPAFNIPSSTTATSFGFGQPSTSNATSLFGSKPIGTGFSSTFGTGTTSTFPSGTTGFGTPQNNSTLFNTFKVPSQTSGFTFGNTPSVVSTGLGTSGSSLFNTSTKPNLFGNSGTTASFNSPGAFGTVSTFGSGSNPLSTINTNLFGSGMYVNNIQQNSNSVPVHQQILALVSAPFGDSPLLKNLLPASGKSEQFLKPPSAASKSPGSLHYKILSSSNSSKIKPKIIPSVPLSKKSLFDGLDEEDPLLEAFQPRPNAKRLVLRPKPISLHQISDKGLEIDKFNNSAAEISSNVLNKENELDERHKTVNDSRSSNSWLKSNFPRVESSKVDDHQSTDQPIIASMQIGLPVELGELENTVSELRSPSTSDYPRNFLNIFTQEVQDLDNSKRKINYESEILKDDSSSELERENTIKDQSHELISYSNIANIKLNRHGYYTIPPLESLHKYVKDKTCIVPHFTIGRKGYGNVYFADSFDIYGLNLDEIVHFRHKEVIIYPDDSMKPPVGKGLNRKAQVTLDRVWPQDKSCHEPITDPKRLIDMDYEGKLRKVSAKHDTKFLDYRPETGSWVFKVEHFSKYGLSDSDDDESMVEGNSNISKLKNENIPKLSENLIHRNSLEIIQASDKYLPTSENNSNNSLYNLDLQQCKSNSKLNDFSSLSSPSIFHARLLGNESHKIQLMKASFFQHNDKANVYEDVLEDSNTQNNRADVTKKQCSALITNISTNNIDYNSSNTFAWPKNIEVNTKSLIHSHNNSKEERFKMSNNSLEIEDMLISSNIKPNFAELMMNYYATPNIDNLLNGKERFKYIADAGVQKGNVFQPSWSSKLSFVSVNMIEHVSKMNPYNSLNQQGIINDSLYEKPTLTNAVQHFQILGENVLCNDFSQIIKSSIEDHLDIQLKYSQIEKDEHNSIMISSKRSSYVDAIHAHSNAAHKTIHDLDNNASMNYISDVWKLCESLWGRTSDYQNFSNSTHEITTQRKEALSAWLKSMTAKIVQFDVMSCKENDHIIFSLLCANQLDEACKLAIESGDHCLALLLSQMGGTLTVRELIKQQIELWHDTNVDGHLSIDRFKLFMLIAGIPTLSQNNATINVYENLDWKRTFAIHLWYISQPTASITDALDLYDSSFTSECSKFVSSRPLPDYFRYDFESDISHGKCIYDLCYNLLKLYCTGNHPLELILNPQNYTYDPFDYRLSWLLQQTLNATGYSHISKYATDLTHANFAAQLESLDLWHWSVFVVLHFNDSNRRIKAVHDLLQRHIDIDNSQGYEDREIFLKHNLNIPVKWINYAKAIKSCSLKRYNEAAWHFIYAEEWNKAHSIIMDHLATDALINGDHNYLKSLLSLLMPPNSSNVISGWTNQGQIILDYITITEEIEHILSDTNCLNLSYKLEILQPQLSSLCLKINAYPCPTVKHRLCQAEMSKRTLQLARSLFILREDEENTSNFLVQLISQLSFPEDYAQQELRPIINVQVNNIIL